MQALKSVCILILFIASYFAGFAAYKEWSKSSLGSRLSVCYCILCSVPWFLLFLRHLSSCLTEEATSCLPRRNCFIPFLRFRA